MTASSLAGLAALNVAYLLVGTTLLWGLRGFETWGTVVRLAGLGYMLGLAAAGIVWTTAVVVGIPFGVGTILISATALAALGFLGGWRAGRRAPSAPRMLRLTLVPAAGIALAGVFFEALFRAARLHGLFAFDGWVFWVPKGKALYFFGGLDEQLFTQLPGPTYPPIAPLVDAAAFHAMGNADTVTMHVQYWFLALGFAAAAAGLLAPHAPSWIMWPPLLLVLVAPRLTENLLTPQGDFLVDYFFVLGALLVALWLREPAHWRIASAGLLLGGAVLTKREGVLFAACVIVSALVVSGRRARSTWPRLLALGGFIALVALPWRLWYRSHGIGGEAPVDPGVGVDGDRFVDALRLSLDVLFDADLWSVVPPVALLAITLGLVTGRRGTAALAALLLLLVTLGGAWITLSYTELPVTADESVNPIVRYTAAAVLLGATLAPLVLGDVWARVAVGTRREPA